MLMMRVLNHLRLHALDEPQKAWRDGALLDADLERRRHGVDDAHPNQPANRERPRNERRLLFARVGELLGRAVDGRGCRRWSRPDWASAAVM